MNTKVLLTVAVFLLAAGVAGGAGPQGVRKTMHNLSMEGMQSGWYPPASYYTENVETQVCIYCHTPHGSNTEGPLWNRNLPNKSGFQHYSSHTLASAVGSATRDVSSESLLCLSCHDGTIAVGSMLNPGVGGVATNSSSYLSRPSALIGGGTVNGRKNLADDHPISFSYTAVVAEVGTGLGKLKDISYPRDTKGLKFFGTDNRVECATCHDPHVNYDPWYDPDQPYSVCMISECDSTADVNYWPFLRIPDNGSDLCFSCHDK